MLKNLSLATVIVAYQTTQGATPLEFVDTDVFYVPKRKPSMPESLERGSTYFKSGSMEQSNSRNSDLRQSWKSLHRRLCSGRFRHQDQQRAPNFEGRPALAPIRVNRRGAHVHL
jgi:hypothetical protein